MGAFSPNKVGARAEPEVKSFDGVTPFFLVRVAVAPSQESAMEYLTVFRKRVPNGPLAVAPMVPNLNPVDADGPIERELRHVCHLACKDVPVVEHLLR